MVLTDLLICAVGLCLVVLNFDCFGEFAFGFLISICVTLVPLRDLGLCVGLVLAGLIRSISWFGFGGTFGFWVCLFSCFVVALILLVAFVD